MKNACRDFGSSEKWGALFSIAPITNLMWPVLSFSVRLKPTFTPFTPHTSSASACGWFPICTLVNTEGVRGHWISNSQAYSLYWSSLVWSGRFSTGQSMRDSQFSIYQLENLRNTPTFRPRCTGLLRAEIWGGHISALKTGASWSKHRHVFPCFQSGNRERWIAWCCWCGVVCMPYYITTYSKSPLLAGMN